MQEFIAADWQSFLEKHKLASFDALWDKEIPWFEEPNVGRSKDGWSGVCLLEIDDRKIFLKKQENFYTYSLRHPLGITVAQKEFANIESFNARKIPCMKTVYFGIRKSKGKLQAMIATEALEAYIAFEDVIALWQKNTFTLKHRRLLIAAVADLLSDAHSKGLMHNSLYPKHIFISEEFARKAGTGTQPLCRFIDMEKAKPAKQHSKKQLRDLETLHRRSSYWSRSDRLYFLLCYLGKNEIDHEVRLFIKKLKGIAKK